MTRYHQSNKCLVENNKDHFIAKIRAFLTLWALNTAAGQHIRFQLTKNQRDEIKCAWTYTHARTPSVVT